MTGVFSSSTKIVMISAFSWAPVNESSTTDASTHGSSAGVHGTPSAHGMCPPFSFLPSKGRNFG